MLCVRVDAKSQSPGVQLYSQSMGSLGPVRVQRRAATNGVARCYAAAAMRATNSSVSVTMRLDKNRRVREVTSCGFRSDPLPRSVSAPEPCDAVLARLDTHIWTARVQPPQQRHRAILCARDGSPQSSHTQRAPHGSLPSLVSAEAAPASYEAIGRTQLLSSLRNCAPSPRPLTNNHGPCRHLQRRARW